MMSTPSGGGLPARAWPSPASVDVRVVVVAAALVAAGTAWASVAGSWRQGLLFLLGAALGLALYHASFGFTSAYRKLLVDRRGGGVRAQMLMLALASLVFFPALGEGSLLGLGVHPSLAPVSVAVVVGACLFGIGMQLGGGCASGTLFAVGGGSTRMVVTLLFFIVGAVLGTTHAGFWAKLPSAGAISAIHSLGWPLALAIHLAVFALIAGFTVLLERRSHEGLQSSRPQRVHWLRGPWPLLWGAVALALGNMATLALSGRPWGISSAFALWGSKAALAVGLDVTAWEAWSAPARAAVLQRSIVHDAASVMDLGIIGGALLATGLAGKFAPVWTLPWKSLAAAVLGGLLLGYGARIAFGCNIGAFFSGVVSGSLHGWVWIAAALLGNWLGTRLRPAFGMSRD